MSLLAQVDKINEIVKKEERRVKINKFSMMPVACNPKLATYHGLRIVGLLSIFILLS